MLDSVVIPAVPVMAWLAAGDSRWWHYGFAIGFVTVALITLSRLALSRR